jgi:hypothetical protein
VQSIAVRSEPDEPVCYTSYTPVLVGTGRRLLPASLVVLCHVGMARYLSAHPQKQAKENDMTDFRVHWKNGKREFLFEVSRVAVFAMLAALYGAGTVADWPRQIGQLWTQIVPRSGPPP